MKDDLTNNLAIDAEDFLQSVLDQSEKFGKVTTAHYHALMDALRCKSAVNMKEASLDHQIRYFYNASLVESAPDAKTKTKMTETQISAKIQNDPEYAALVKSSDEAESYLAYVENILEGMKQRYRMLEVIAKRLED